MTYEELEIAYFKQTSVLGGTRTALKKTREHRDILQSRVDALEAVLVVVHIDQSRFDELLKAVSVIQRELTQK